MYRTVLSTTALLLVIATTVSAQGTQSEEAQAWDAVKDSSASADVFAFIEAYPNGEFTKDAQALMIDLLWAELAATGPETEAETATEQADNTQEAVTVTFSDPLTEGDAAIVGRSLEELIQGTPLFPPVEGLPESYWKTQECSNCHEWEQANLCTQANTYLTDAGSANLVKEHPYGGTFKLNLRNWAMAGCE